MSYPTVLGPWFVVQKLHRQPIFPLGDAPDIVEVQYCKTDADGEVFTNNTKEATLYMSLHHAVRVAKALAGEIRVLTSKEELEEFRPKGEI